MSEERIKEAKKKLAEMNKIIETLDPAVRATAFELLIPVFFDDTESDEESTPPAKPKTAKRNCTRATEIDAGAFFNAYDHDKPHENVHLIAAWLYSQHGVMPVTKQDIVNCADDAGLTVPDRPDNTMRYAKKDGKTLYRQRSGGWQLTVKGEAYVKDTYNVRKGNKPRPGENTE